LLLNAECWMLNTCMIWRTLLVVYPSIDLRDAEPPLGRTRFRHRLSEAEVDAALASFLEFPGLVSNYTGGRATIDPIVRFIDRPLQSLTPMGGGMYWPSPDDTRPELEQFSPEGAYESLFVFWPQRDLETGQAIPTGGWGLAIAASEWSNGATYAAIANIEIPVWRIPTVGEVWLHEWLHGVCGFFASRGYTMPDGDADGGERHGYVQSPVTGWSDYYRDLMSGQVREGDRLTGIPLEAWKEGPGWE
jgi:hypothetical protein